MNNTEKARIFCLYHGSEIKLNELEENEIVKGILTGVNCVESDDYQAEYARIIGYHTDEEPCCVAFDDCQLILKQLSDITDEDAVQLVKIEYGVFDNTGCEFKIVKGRRNKQVVVLNGGKHLHTFEVSASKLRYEAFYFLIQQRYAVPLFIAPNHPDNGKTAIQLGLAIDAKTLPPQS